MSEKIVELLQESINYKQTLASDSAVISRIAEAARALKATQEAGGTIYSCGNGGSTCDAMHLTEELVARYKRERPGIKAMHLMDPAIMTCWGNDYAFEAIFKRQVETFCNRADTLIGISTSGNSKNVIAAVEAAKMKGTTTIGLLGKDGGALSKLCDIPIVVSGKDTERIQECHITIIHIWCELLES